jgi:hypothetical protein
MQEVEIKVKGHIDQSWSEQLEGLHIDYTTTGETILTGFIQDQSALYGLINHLASLGLELVFVSSLPEEIVKSNDTNLGSRGKRTSFEP